MRGKSENSGENPEGQRSRGALSFAELRAELTAAVGVAVGTGTLMVTLFRFDLLTPADRHAVAAAALLAEALYLLCLLGWGLWSRRHGRALSALLGAGCALALAGGLWLVLTFTGQADQQPTATGSGTATPTGTGTGTATPSSSPPAGSPGATPSTSPSGLPGLPPPGTPGPGPGPSTSRHAEPAPSTSYRSLDDPRPTNGQAPPVNEQRSVTLNTTPGDDSVWMDYWRQEHERGGDLNMDQNGIFTTLGAQLTIMPGSAEPDWFACRDAAGMTGRANFSALRVGMYLCARSREGRVARLRVTALPSSPSSNGRFIFYGVVWHRA